MFVETLLPPVLISQLLIEPVTPNDPEIFTVFAVKSPFINGTPEPEAMYSLLLSSVVVEGPAQTPIAILFEEFPVKFNPEDLPSAMLFDPELLKNKAWLPIAKLWDPDVLLHKERYPIAVLFVPVLEELKFVVEPIEIFVETFPPPVLISKLLIEPVTPKDPVIKALPVYGNVVSGAYEALNACVAYEAVPKSDPVMPFDTVSEFSEAFEPDTTTLFQFGI